jgi:CHAT domain-containing protein
VNYEADLNLTAERNDIVVRRIDELITGPMADHAMPATILLQLALAHDGLELADPSRPSRAGEMFVRLAKDESLPRHLRIYTNLRLAIRHLTAGRPEDAATVLVEIDRLLLADDNTEAAAPLWREAGMLRLVRSRIARALGAGEQEMATHLEEVGAAYDNLLEIWAGTPLLPGGLGFLQWGDRQELLSELLTLRAAYDPRGARAGLDDLLAGEAHGSLARRLRLPIPTFEEISAALVDDGGIVAYVPSARGGHIFTIDRDRVELWDLTIKSVLDRMARDASAAAFAVDAESTRRLVEHLLPDPIVERVRAWSHVYVVGLSELPELPFESLPLGAQPGAPILGRTLPIARLPSISVGVWLARDAAETAPARPDDLALWVVPEPSLAVLARWPDLQRIPFGDDERARLQSAFGPSDGAPFLRHPSRSTLTEGSARDARVLNLWCHGAWDEASERPASLVLAPDGDDDDGLVGCGAVEVPARDYPPLVVLSACGAALGPRRPGDDGVEHLGGAFLMGGARTVLLASGELGYRAALGFTESFYDHLASGRSPAEAMRRARADSNSGAGLRLIGLAHRPLFSAPAAPASRGLPASMTVLAIVALGGWLVTRRGRPSSTPSRA